LRTAILSGIPPYRSGLYHNAQKLRDGLPRTDLLPRHLSRHGYWSAGSGKLLHYIVDPVSWHEYFPEKTKDDPFPRTFDPAKRPGEPSRRRTVVCDRAVSLTDLYRTLCESSGLPPAGQLGDRSLVPLLRDPKAAWRHAAITQR
jgi:arylsulfatase A-like enzyme